MAQLSQAEILKNEGNALFVKNDFSKAYKKYTAAINLDKENAVLYCNRAACAFGLNRYLDSAADASKATQLDPGYAKAWGRLATANMSLSRPDKAIDAWKRALAALPSENLTPAQKKSRASYTADLAAAEAKVAELAANTKPRPEAKIVSANAKDSLPWNRATALLLENPNQWESSAWVIKHAHMEWTRAMDCIKQVRIIAGPGGQTGYVGHTGGLAPLSNAIMTDTRIFHIAEPNFIDMYNKQVRLEMSKTNAWKDSGAKEVIELAPKRLAAEGWDSVRPALSATVRGWILRGYMEEWMTGHSTSTTLGFYSAALEVLQWGSEKWKDVPPDDRGAVFQSTFIRVVKCLKLNALMNSYEAASRVGPVTQFSLDELLSGANELLEEMEAADIPDYPPLDQPVGFFLAFYKYPRSRAHEFRAFCFSRKAGNLRDAGRPGDEADQYSLQAAEEYLQAAQHLPADDANHLLYLHCGLHAKFEVRGSVSFLLSVTERMEKALPSAKRLWESSTHWATIVSGVDGDIRMRAKVKAAMDKGKLNADDVFTINELLQVVQ